MVAHEGKARGSESGASESMVNLLRGVFVGEELGNGRGELPASTEYK